MKIGDSILCPIFSMTHIIGDLIPDRKNVFKIVRVDDKNFLELKITEEMVGRPYGEILLRFKICCTGISVATLGHFWIEDVLLNDKLVTLWESNRNISLVMDKEIDKSGPGTLKIQDFNSGEQLMAWISISYPRVILYHSMGLFLLRSASSEYVYADAILNFFKIIEIVVHSRTKNKPTLKVILEESRKLKIAVLDEKEIKEFYKIRSRDAAHDWGKVETVGRKEAVECKMWAEEFIIRDMVERKNQSINY
jgi:hypothetical protein